MGRYSGLLGLIAIVLLRLSLFDQSQGHPKARHRLGLVLQFSFAFLVLKTPFGDLFHVISQAVNALLNYSSAGASFVFGDKLGLPDGGFGVIIAFQVLPIVIFISSLFSILYYLGVMQLFVKGMAIIMQRFMGTSGAESTSVAASIVMGQTEAPLTIRPFLEKLTMSELFTIMTSGMAHVSGSVMAAYVMIAHVSISHLLTAVIMTAPATIMLAKMFMPETGVPTTRGKVDVKVDKPGVNLIDAAARGAGDGLHLALNIAGMLIAFLALVAMVNGGMGWVHALYQLVPGLAAAIAVAGLRPDRLAIRRRLERLRDGRRPAWHAHGVERVCGVCETWAKWGRPSASIPSLSRPLPCAASRISARLRFRSAESARWRHRASRIWRDSGFKAMIVGTLANFMSACIAGMLNPTGS